MLFHSLQVLGDKCKGLQGGGGHSSPEPEDKCKGLQGRGGHNSLELGDKCRHGEANVKQRIAGDMQVRGGRQM